MHRHVMALRANRQLGHHGLESHGKKIALRGLKNSL
jgi:hypothetical protein